MLKFGETKVTKEKFYAAKKARKIWYVNIGTIVISVAVKTKTSYKYLIEYLDKAVRPLVLVTTKMSGYAKTFKVKYGDKDKFNKLASFHIDDKKLLGKYKAIWTKIEDLKSIELSALPVYDDRYTKTKIRTYDDKVYTKSRGLNVPEDDIECESFTVISIDSLVVYENKYCLQVYLHKCAYTFPNQQMMKIYLDDNLFED